MLLTRQVWRASTKRDLGFARRCRAAAGALPDLTPVVKWGTTATQPLLRNEAAQPVVEP